MRGGTHELDVRDHLGLLMAPRELPYREGDAFGVPLRGGGYAIGVVARMDGKGAVLGYFFGRRVDSPPAVGDLRGLAALDAVWIGIFGDLGFLDHSWPVIGRLPNWRREEWPMPAFGRSEKLTGRCFRVEYPDDDPGSHPRETPITREEFERLPKDGSAGFGFVEARMTRLLGQHEQ